MLHNSGCVWCIIVCCAPQVNVNAALCSHSLSTPALQVHWDIKIGEASQIKKNTDGEWELATREQSVKQHKKQKRETCISLVHNFCAASPIYMINMRQGQCAQQNIIWKITAQVQCPSLHRELCLRGAFASQLALVFYSTYTTWCQECHQPHMVAFLKSRHKKMFSGMLCLRISVKSLEACVCLHPARFTCQCSYCCWSWRCSPMRRWHLTMAARCLWICEHTAWQFALSEAAYRCALSNPV